MGDASGFEEDGGGRKAPTTAIGGSTDVSGALGTVNRRPSALH